MNNIICALTRARAVIYAIAYIKHICILTTKSSSTTTKVRARSMHTPNTMHKYYTSVVCIILWILLLIVRARSIVRAFHLLYAYNVRGYVKYDDRAILPLGQLAARPARRAEHTSPFPPSRRVTVSQQPCRRHPPAACPSGPRRIVHTSREHPHPREEPKAK